MLGLNPDLSAFPLGASFHRDAGCRHPRGRPIWGWCVGPVPSVYIYIYYITVYYIYSTRDLCTVVAPPSSVVKCSWEVLVWGFRVLFLSCVGVSVSGVLFSVGVCLCVGDLLICLPLPLCLS